MVMVGSNVPTDRKRGHVGFGCDFGVDFRQEVILMENRNKTDLVLSLVAIFISLVTIVLHLIE